ncbi:MAG: ComF family protein [Janthinobacterium lividum]
MTSGLCATCWEKIHFIDHPLCDKCGMPFEIREITKAVCLGCLQDMPCYHQLRSVFPYDDTSKPLILQFKHGDALHLVPLLVRWLAQAGQSLLVECDMIMPVPLHWLRLWRRSYNQAAVLAQGLGRFSGKSYAPDVLRRHRSTASQGTKSSQQRHSNVKGSFSIKPTQVKSIEGKNILLIDDVYASGATISECVKILKKSGANQVDVLTLARVLGSK